MVWPKSCLKFLNQPDMVSNKSYFGVQFLEVGQTKTISAKRVSIQNDATINSTVGNIHKFTLVEKNCTSLWWKSSNSEILVASHGCIKILELEKQYNRIKVNPNAQRLTVGLSHS